MLLGYRLDALRARLRAAGLRLERMRASPLWVGDGFRNVHPIRAGLRDANAKFPTQLSW